MSNNKDTVHKWINSLGIIIGILFTSFTFFRTCTLSEKQQKLANIEAIVSCRKRLNDKVGLFFHFLHPRINSVYHCMISDFKQKMTNQCVNSLKYINESVNLFRDITIEFEADYNNCSYQTVQKINNYNNTLLNIKTFITSLKWSKNSSNRLKHIERFEVSLKKFYYSNYSKGCCNYNK